MKPLERFVVVGAFLMGVAWVGVGPAVASPDFQAVINRVGAEYLAHRGWSQAYAERSQPADLAVCIGHAIRQQAGLLMNQPGGHDRLNALVQEAENYLLSYLVRRYGYMPAYRALGQGRGYPTEQMRNAFNDGLHGVADGYIAQNYGVRSSAPASAAGQGQTPGWGSGTGANIATDPTPTPSQGMGIDLLGQRETKEYEGAPCWMCGLPGVPAYVCESPRCKASRVKVVPGSPVQGQ